MRDIKLSPEEERKYFADVESVRELAGAGGRRPGVYIRTFGCQQNEADSEKIAGMAESMGYCIQDRPEGASLIVVNTCAVREHAEKRALSVIGQYKHLKAADPSVIIAVCGCMVSQGKRADQLKRSYPYVDFSFGTSDLHLFPALLLDRLKGGRRVFRLPPDEPPVPEIMPTERGSSYRAWVSIMYGCNNFCSYCIVPYVRGRERSREPDAVIGEVRDLVARGYRDITLLGQNVNSYGRGCSFDCDFTELLRRADGIDGDFLLRFMTSHPKDATPELIDAIAGGRHVARQFHLPAQSGSDAVLRAMNRGYTREKYTETLRLIKEKIPGCVVSTDIIVGFPGETEADFEDTLSLLREAEFDMVFSFIYSPRAGTPAAAFVEAVDAKTAGERMQRLLELQTGISAEKNAAYTGREIRVLTCGRSRTDTSVTECRTEGGKLLHIRETVPEGVFVKVKVTGTGAFVLEGELAETI